MTDAYRLYRPCPKCNAHGDENFRVAYVVEEGKATSVDAPAPVRKPASKIKIVCKRCGHARDAA